MLSWLGQNEYRVGRNLVLVSRYAAGETDRLPALAGEIAAENVNIVVAIGEPSVRAMLGATTATPIVMVVGADPVSLGFVSCIARPGGRVTGLEFQTFEGDVKRLELLGGKPFLR